MIKNAQPKTINQLFDPHNDIHYEIPKYQREYSWGKEQWAALFNDLMGEDALAGHFLGTMIGVEKSESVHDDKVLEVVDGQQRITTVALLLIAIHSELVERREIIENEDDRSDLNNLKRMLVTGSPLKPRVALQVQNSNSADFLSVLKAGQTGVEAESVNWAGNRRITKAYLFFKACLRDRMEAEDGPEVGTLMDVLSRTTKAVMVALEVQSNADAFVLFESLNNRGLALTPIDLIKNSLLARADVTEGMGIDRAYELWEKWLRNLGTEYRDQERFFRQFYNAFKNQWGLALPNIPVATRLKVITIFEKMLKGDLTVFANQMDKSTSAYKMLLGGDAHTAGLTPLEKALLDLSRVEGAPSYILMLSLLVNRDEYGLVDDDLIQVSNLLISFFVRRNLTNTPPTYALDRLFILIVETWDEDTLDSPVEKVRRHLEAVSVSDDVFLEKLGGPIYEENLGITRFILILLAQSRMDNVERWTDLWARVNTSTSKPQYRWTIEHVAPQGPNMPASWVEMLGGQAEADRVLNEDIHRLGNLTITGYNSTLGNLSFRDKRDRLDSREPHSPVGYNNGLELNRELATAEAWTGTDIKRRTNELALAALEMFPLT